MSTLHEETLAIFMVPSSTEEKGYYIEAVPECKSYWAHCDAIKLCEHQLAMQLDIPDKATLARLAIETLQARQTQILTQAELDRQDLQLKIDALLQLEYLP